MSRIVMVMAVLMMVSACSSQQKQEIKDGGRQVGETTRDVTRDIGHATRDAARETGHFSAIPPRTFLAMAVLTGMRKKRLTTATSNAGACGNQICDSIGSHDSTHTLMRCQRDVSGS